ncbi:hypothetical protein Droror1_Dr00022153 [Drosera rotundifolia]
MESLSLFLPSSLPFKPLLSPKTTPKPSHFPSLKTPFPLKPHLSLPILLSSISFPFPSIASELPLSTDPSFPTKINLEAIVVSVDDFLTYHPFFVYSVAFIWLIAIPLVQAELRKCKFVSAEDAFLKLRDDPRAQLLDIRDEKSVRALCSPNLRILNKETVQVWFPKEAEEEEENVEDDGFVKRVLERFGEPKDTVVCVLDHFDGNSMKAAQLLYKNGFIETYAIEGGVLGKKGWKEIQEQYIPPSAHIVSKKKTKKSMEREVNGAYPLPDDQMNGLTPATNSEAEVAGIDTNYYADIEPPSSPSPSKP